ncbi:phosphodiester glycosidase family protein [Streptomyces sp. NPDC089799]|uniref:phosphodiester glycosidase family protein n=1 Tax=Streptomyces sp. NPDC089799 TaxID=3155066 RepID=UPI00341EA84A
MVDTRFGDTLTLDPSMYVTAGGDLLMRDGVIAYTQPPTNADGSPYVPDAAPRTAVGTDGYGRTVLVTVDGRRTAISRGAARSELATLLKDLGVVDALNMDGGGSTTLVWQNAVGNHPSDGTETEAERPVGDAVYAGAGGYPLAWTPPSNDPGPAATTVRPGSPGSSRPRRSLARQGTPRPRRAGPPRPRSRGCGRGLWLRRPTAPVTLRRQVP